MNFLQAYGLGQPVCVRKEGEVIALCAGFAVFHDGVSWADDAVIQEQPARPPYHHLRGEVRYGGGAINCMGHSFEVVSQDDRDTLLYWESFASGAPTDIAPFHEGVEYNLRRDRCLNWDV